ncbi:hypothetical protein T01_14928 [Trichinella spiralis]|uniref:Uncharacterized protein n=1 Tax=Trichinella spiralis TaxID=6334 RepID=A0A0V1BQ36_TRISP|nr:hypothetical protein T01_14928 [Trichinella spiralis]
MIKRSVRRIFAYVQLLKTVLAMMRFKSGECDLINRTIDQFNNVDDYLNEKDWSGKRRCENFAELKTILRYNSDLKNQNVIMIKHGKRMFSWLQKCYSTLSFNAVSTVRLGMDGTCLPEIACKFLLSCYAFACVALVAVVVGVQCAVYEQQDVFTGKTDKQRANIWMKIDVEYVIIMSQYGIVKLKLFFQTRLRDEF